MLRITRAPSFCRGLALAALVVLPTAAGAQELFSRGDANVDGEFSMDDPMYVLHYLFGGEDSFACYDAGDINDSGRMDIADAIYAFDYLFRGGGPPAVPFGECGEDPTYDDSLGCLEFAVCEGDDLCLDAAALEDILVDLPELPLCLPAGLLAFEQEGLEVVVCPEDGAPDCEGLGITGCGFAIERLGLAVEEGEPAVVVRIDARLESLPVDVTEPLFGTTTTCDVSLGGEEEGTPMIIEMVFPLAVEPLPDGNSEITGLDEPFIDFADASMDVDGPIVCALFAAGEDLFLQLLAAPIELVAQGLVEPLEPLVVGLQLCE